MLARYMSYKLATAFISQCEKSGQFARKKNGESELFRYLAEKPGPAQRPQTVGGAATDAQSIGRILV